MGLFGFGKKKSSVQTEDVATVTPIAVPSVPIFEHEGHLVVKLFCSAGASTSLWAQNVQRVMDAEEFDGEIASYSISEIDSEGKHADLILIGPQTKYMESKVRTSFPAKPVSIIPMKTFALMNGDLGLDYIKSLVTMI
jgi:PTS system cellobiose-specific IIB component